MCSGGARLRDFDESRVISTPNPFVIGSSIEYYFLQSLGLGRIRTSLHFSFFDDMWHRRCLNAFTPYSGRRPSFRYYYSVSLLAPDGSFRNNTLGLASLNYAALRYVVFLFLSVSPKFSVWVSKVGGGWLGASRRTSR